MATQNNNIRYPNLDDEEDKLEGFDLSLAEPVGNASDGINAKTKGSMGGYMQNMPHTRLNAPSVAKPKSVTTSVAKPLASNQVVSPAPSEELSGTEQILRAAYERGLKENPLETEEQKKKRIRRDRARSIISGIADMGSALSNLYFTTQGAPSTQNAPTMTARNSERMEKAKAEREKTLQNHLNYALNLNKLEQDADEKKYKRMIEERRVVIAEAKAEREDKLANLRAMLMGNQIDKAEFEAKKAEVEAKYAEDIQLGKVNLGKAKVATEGARQDSYEANAAKANRTDPNASKSKQGKSVGSLTINGVTTEYYNAEDYKKAVRAAAREAGIPTEKLGQARTTSDIAVDVENHYKSKPQSTTSSTPKAPASSQSNAKTTTQNSGQSSGKTTGKKRGHFGLKDGKQSETTEPKKHAVLK